MDTLRYRAGETYRLDAVNGDSSFIELQRSHMPEFALSGHPSWRGLRPPSVGRMPIPLFTFSQLSNPVNLARRIHVHLRRA
jgi:hypothetical protein